MASPALTTSATSRWSAMRVGTEVMGPRWRSGQGAGLVRTPHPALGEPQTLTTTISWGGATDPYPGRRAVGSVRPRSRHARGIEPCAGPRSRGRGSGSCWSVTTWSGGAGRHRTAGGDGGHRHRDGARGPAEHRPVRHAVPDRGVDRRMVVAGARRCGVRRWAAGQSLPWAWPAAGIITASVVGVSALVCSLRVRPRWRASWARASCGARSTGQRLRPRSRRSTSSSRSPRRP